MNLRKHKRIFVFSINTHVYESPPWNGRIGLSYTVKSMVVFDNQAMQGASTTTVAGQSGFLVVKLDRGLNVGGFTQ